MVNRGAVSFTRTLPQRGNMPEITKLHVVREHPLFGANNMLLQGMGCQGGVSGEHFRGAQWTDLSKI